MKILAMHKSSAFNEGGHRPAPEMIAAMGQLVGAMMQSGTLVTTEGLCPSAQGARLTFSRGKRTVTPGPLAGENEHIAGFGILRVRNLEEAIEWATKFADTIGDSVIDVRPVSEPWDIGAGPRPDGLATRRYMAARFANGRRTVTDGPFTEAKELIAGYAVLEAPSVKAAIDLSAVFAKIIGDIEIDFLPIVAMDAH